MLYGVTVAGAGLVYVGQSTDARRRLRDLPVGESHHLATTVPPETWTKVLVIEWPPLLDTIPAGEARTASALGHGSCGLALEHHLQLACRPVLSSRRRGSAGQWNPRNLDSSRSRGAQARRQLPQLCRVVTAAWEALTDLPAPCSGPPVTTIGTGRVVFPQALL